MSYTALPSDAVDKERARAGHKSRRDRLPKAALHLASMQVIPHVLDFLGPNPTVVGMYASFRSELPTLPLIDALLGAGHRVAIPRLDADQMRFVEVIDIGSLVPGRFGIPTSDGPHCDDELEIVFCPGLAFTPCGTRLGYGGGFYDRYLSARPSIRSIGLAMECQIVRDLPFDGRDRSMVGIITEAGLRQSDPTRSIDVVAAAIIHQDEVLVARRGPNVSHSGWWEFPGGKIEPGEAPAKAIEREIHEELGWMVDAFQPLDSCRHMYPKVHVNMELWVCMPRPQEHDVRLTPPRSTDHDRLLWARVEDLETLPFAAADITLLDCVRRILTSAS